jgi:hypothetical protein
MAQTPKSVSVGIQGLTNTTIYTVPALKTAVVKAVIGANADNGGSTFTISKAISGQNYPISTNQSPVAVNATGGTTIRGVNLLGAPITMAAGEQLKAYSALANLYNLPNVSTAGTTTADGSTYAINVQVFANGIYMATGSCTSGVYVATSTDAVTWTQRTSALPFGTTWNRLSCNGSIWVAANANNSQGTVYYSSDNGVTWTPANLIAAADNVSCLINNGTTFMAGLSNGRIYTSTNGSTWTENSAYNTATNSSFPAIYNLGWTGTHWIVDTVYGALQSSDLTTWGGYTGVNLGRVITNIYSTAWSTAYSKYYSTRLTASVPNIFSSPNGLAWTTLSTLGITPYKICCAGANTVLIGVPSTGVTTRYKSTDGATFTSTSDAGGYTGPVFGFENGYFLSMQNNGTNDALALSTDPTTSTGSTRSSTVASFVINSACSSPTKWVGVGSNGTNMYFIGGATATSTGSSFNTGYTIATYGTPRSVCWSAADNYFYVITNTGNVWRMTDYDSGPILVSTGALPSGDANCIKVVGTTMYVVSSDGASVNLIYTGSTLTGGASWVGYSYATVNSYAFRNMGNIQRTGGYFGENLATNGTDLVWNNVRGYAYALTPSVSVTGMRMPVPFGVGTVQTVNSNQFMYGGYSNEYYGPVQAYFTSTNVITTYGTFVNLRDQNGNLQYWLNSGTQPNIIAYLGGTYYVTSTNINSYIWNGTLPTNILNTAGIGSTIAGVPVVNPSLGWSFDGTNIVSMAENQNLTKVCKTSNPASFLYSATMTASVVEID